MKRRVNVYIDDDLILLVRSRDENFNMSSFFNECLSHLVLGDEMYEDPRKIAAKRAAEEIIKERARQRHLVELERTAEAEALELMKRDEEIFLKAVKKEIPFPDGYIDCLPTYGDKPDEFWQKKAAVISSLCNFPVNPERVIQYVRTETDVYV